MSAEILKDTDSNGPTQDFVTMVVAGQAFGIPVLHVRDVLGPQRITRVPLAPPEIEGSLNLRGRIVTAVNMRQRLQLPKSDAPEKAMAVVVEYEDEPYSLLVDEVGEVLRLRNSQRDNNPATLDAKWRQIADGLYRLDGSLLIVLNIAAVLGAIRAEA
ncbi:MAG: chemotaxis protein CheW [Parvibaculum sp.]|nr:chemotaxis protein CheW [Parvibaculum sp.]